MPGLAAQDSVRHIETTPAAGRARLLRVNPKQPTIYGVGDTIIAIRRGPRGDLLLGTGRPCARPTRQRGCTRLLPRGAHIQDLTVSPDGRDAYVTTAGPESVITLSL